MGPHPKQENHRPPTELGLSALIMKCAEDGERDVLYMIIGVLAVAALVLGYQFYQAQQRTIGIQIDLAGNVSIETK